VRVRVDALGLLGLDGAQPVLKVERGVELALGGVVEQGGLLGRRRVGGGRGGLGRLLAVFGWFVGVWCKVIFSQ
jgi:hypothetical protein